MSDKSKYVIDKRPPRVDRAKLERGPREADLREIPATTAADWENAEVLIPIDEETYREFQSFLAARQQKSSRG
jgi:hypothetical protein